ENIDIEVARNKQEVDIISEAGTANKLTEYSESPPPYYYDGKITDRKENGC
ncbi:15332_t:CDS:1, partial [Entrophospora sp. SA101]